MNQKPATPKDAAAVILLNRKNEVLWARRNPRIAFLGGYHAFPGGKLDASDSLVAIENCPEAELAPYIACAAREIFEETGILLARGGEKLTKGQRASLHDELISGRLSFAEILADWDLRIDAADFFYTGFWTTPQFSPARFKTRFFLAFCPAKQTPYAAISEMENVEFVKPEAALDRWRNGAVLISPPVLLTLKTLNEFPDRPEFSDDSEALNLCARKLFENSSKAEGQINFIELNPRVICFPLKTETLPPATHTNCFIVGRKKFVVIDAASRDESARRDLHLLVDSLLERNFVCEAIITTHLHHDHFGGETALQKHIFDKFAKRVPLAAHRLTAENLRGKVEFQRLLEDGEIFDLEEENGAKFHLKTLHTPGHARGHLAFYDAEFGFLLSGDNVINSGSVVIAPPEGDMKIYLETLEKMRDLPNLRFLCGSHGAAVFDAKGKITKYVLHRLEREKQILEAIQNGAKTPKEIVQIVYRNLDSSLISLAEKSVAAHLIKLETNLENGGKSSAA